MRSSRPVLVASCAVVLIWGSLAPPPAAAEKRSVRHFPTSTWCSIVSGFPNTPPEDLELPTPYTFHTPVGQTKATLFFKANNVSPADANDFSPKWNRQSIDSVVVLRATDLPGGQEPQCFFNLSGGPSASAPAAFPLLSTPAAFRDDFLGGAKPEWGTVPTGSAAGDASAPVFWQPPLGYSNRATDILHENFDDGVGNGWTAAGFAGGTNLWHVAVDDAASNGCSPFTGTGQLAFSQPDPACSYDSTSTRQAGTYTSPVIDLTTTGEAFIAFRHRFATGTNDQAFAVDISTDGGANWIVPPVFFQSAGDFSTFGATRAESIQILSRSATFRFRFRFDTGAFAETDEGWFIDNVKVAITQGLNDGSLGLGRGTLTAPDQFLDPGDVTASLNLSNLAPDTDYAVMAKWTAANGDDHAHPVLPDGDDFVVLTLDHIFDSIAPTNPTLSSPSHTPNVWSQTGQVTVQWSGAADPAGGTGLAGYSRAFDAVAATVPDTTVDTAHASDPHSFVTGALTDGGSYYFHLRTCDLAVNCSTTVHLGPFRIDRVAPGTAQNLSSPSHTVNVDSADRTIDISWTSATDATAGVDGYAFTFDNNPTWVCDQVKDVEETATGTTSATLAVGSWYFHVCTRDNAGLWSAVSNLGPFPLILDSTPPTNPALSSPTHTVGLWSKANVVTVNWSGAADTGGAGLAGYSVAFDTAATTTPNTSVDVVQATDPHSTNSAPLPDGASHYFHLRTCDAAANCTAVAVHLGPFLVDQTAPGTVSGLTSPSHSVGVSSADPTIDVTWSAATDASSGVDGYSVFFDSASTAVCDQTKDVEETATTATSLTLASGTWYAHICTRDNAGNWSAVANAGPYVVGTGGSTSARLRTLTPCRLVDTRDPAGDLGGPALAAGQERPFTADLGCGIPPTARALSVNVTVVSPTAPGNLRLYSPGSGVPLSSVINYTPGQTRANNGIVPLNPARQFAVRCDQASGTVHLLVDVNGYFE